MVSILGGEMLPKARVMKSAKILKALDLILRRFCLEVLKQLHKSQGRICEFSQEKLILLLTFLSLVPS